MVPETAVIQTVRSYGVEGFDDELGLLGCSGVGVSLKRLDDMLEPIV